MDFVLTPAIVLFIAIAVWLWRLGKEQITDLAVEILLAPGQEVTTSPIFKPSAIKVWYGRAIEWLRAIFPLVILVGFVLGIAVGIYLLIMRGQGWLTLILVLALLLLYFYFGFAERMMWREEMRYPYAPLPPMKVEYAGEATLPKKVYEGDSQNISVDLRPAFWILAIPEEAFSIQNMKSGKSIKLQLLQDSTFEQFLEVELLAAGLTVDGDKRQRCRLTLEKLSYRWNCYFPNSGHHAITLAFRLVCSSDVIELGVIQHTIKVVKLDNLTRRQVWLMASLAGVVSGGLAIAEALHRLSVW